MGWVANLFECVRRWIHGLLHSPSLMEQFEQVLEAESIKETAEGVDPFGRFKAKNAGEQEK